MNLVRLIAYLAILLLVGCNGGGTSGTGVIDSTEIQGELRDEKGDPIPNANLSIKGYEDLGEAVTDSSGNFTLQVPSHEAAEVLIEYNGKQVETIINYNETLSISTESALESIFTINNDGSVSIDAATILLPSDPLTSIDPVINPCSSDNPSICGEALYCDFIDLSCGKPGGFGVCRNFAEICIEIYSPVCGCDGKTYGNYCEAQGAGISISKQSEC